MKAIELRIGNWISAIYEHEIDRGDGIVEDVESSDVVQFIGYDPFSNYIWTEGGFRDEYCEFNPIPLTEEWHNKFGVELDGFKSFRYKIPKGVNQLITVVFSGDYVYLRQGIGSDINDDMVCIWNNDLTKRGMYVHEWQNLYHDLTGEELTITKQ